MIISEDKKEEITRFVREQLTKHFQDNNFEFSTNKKISETYGIDGKNLMKLLHESLSEEEIKYRLQNIKVQQGRKGYALLSEEQKIKNKKQMGNNVRNHNFSLELVQTQLQSEGWKTRRLFLIENIGDNKNPIWISTFDLEGLVIFLRGVPKREELIKKLYQLNQEKNKLQDLICRKGKNIKFIEVKNKRGMRSPEEKPIIQQKAIEEVWKLGFETELVNIVIDLEDLEKFAKNYKTNKVIIECDEKGVISFRKN